MGFVAFEAKESVSFIKFDADNRPANLNTHGPVD